MGHANVRFHLLQLLLSESLHNKTKINVTFDELINDGAHYHHQSDLRIPANVFINDSASLMSHHHHHQLSPHSLMEPIFYDIETLKMMGQKQNETALSDAIFDGNHVPPPPSDSGDLLSCDDLWLTNANEPLIPNYFFDLEYDHPLHNVSQIYDEKDTFISDDFLEGLTNDNVVFEELVSSAAHDADESNFSGYFEDNLDYVKDDIDGDPFQDCFNNKDIEQFSLSFCESDYHQDFIDCISEVTTEPEPSTSSQQQHHSVTKSDYFCNNNLTQKQNIIKRKRSTKISHGNESTGAGGKVTENNVLQSSGIGETRDIESLRQSGIPLTYEQVISPDIQRFKQLVTNMKLSDVHRKICLKIRRRNTNRRSAMKLRQGHIDNDRAVQDDLDAVVDRFNHLKLEYKKGLHILGDLKNDFQYAKKELLNRVKNWNGQSLTREEQYSLSAKYDSKSDTVIAYKRVDSAFVDAVKKEIDED